MSKMRFNHPVLDYFSEISQIPRGSYNEAEISDWIVCWARKRHLDVLQDRSGNVLIRKSASEGYELSPVVMLQAHLDMVCVKNSGSDHDFEKDPIEFVLDGDILHAKDTTLGADDGLGVAYILAVLDDDTIAHPALECLLTTAEEVGMIGVKNMDNDLFQLKAKVMINLDAGNDGVFIAGCAGGGRVSLKVPIAWDTIPEQEAFEITISGLLGGHSGAEIHLNRANACILLGRVLREMGPFIRLHSISGGGKENSIPLLAQAVVTVQDAQLLNKILPQCQESFRREFAEGDPFVTVTARPAGKVSRVYTQLTLEKVIEALYLIPCGIMSRNLKMNQVLTSSSLGIVSSDEKEVVFTSALRSSVESELFGSLVPKFEMLSRLLGADIIQENFYTGWEYRPDSRVGALAEESYRKYGVKEPVTTVVHGGLECGMLMDYLGQVDCIAMSPETHYAHSPRECMSISSAKRYFDVLKELLSRL